MEQLKKEDEYMNASLSISPEKYFDTKFDYQEKLFTEKFNGLNIKIDMLDNKIDTEVKRLSDKIDMLDNKIDTEVKRLSDKIDMLDNKIDTEVKRLSDKIDISIGALDKKFTWGFGIIISMFAVMLAFFTYFATIIH